MNLSRLLVVKLLVFSYANLISINLYTAAQPSFLLPNCKPNKRSKKISKKYEKTSELEVKETRGTITRVFCKMSSAATQGELKTYFNQELRILPPVLIPKILEYYGEGRYLKRNKEISKEDLMFILFNNEVIVSEVIVSYDGNSMAFSSQEHHTVITATPTKQKKYHVIAEQEIDTKALVTVQPVCFSYNNKYLAIRETYGNSSRQYIIRDLHSDKSILTIPIDASKNKHYNFNFSADSSRAVVTHTTYGKFDSSITIYDVENKRKDQIYPKVKELFLNEHPLQKHSYYNIDSISKDGKFMSIYFPDYKGGTSIIWDIDKDRRIDQIKQKIQFAFTKQMFAYVTSTGFAIIDCTTKSKTTFFVEQDQQDTFEDIFFDSSDRWVYLICSKSIICCDLATASAVKTPGKGVCNTHNYYNNEGSISFWYNSSNNRLIKSKYHFNILESIEYLAICDKDGNELGE